MSIAKRAADGINGFVANNPFSTLGVANATASIFVSLNLIFRTAEGQRYALTNFLLEVHPSAPAFAGLFMLISATFVFIGFLYQHRPLIEVGSWVLGLLWFLTSWVYLVSGLWGFLFSVGLFNTFITLYLAYYWLVHFSNRLPILKREIE